MCKPLDEAQGTDKSVECEANRARWRMVRHYARCPELSTTCSACDIAFLYVRELLKRRHERQKGDIQCLASSSL